MSILLVCMHACVHVCICFVHIFIGVDFTIGTIDCMIYILTEVAELTVQSCNSHHLLSVEFSLIHTALDHACLSPPDVEHFISIPLTLCVEGPST